MASISSDTPTFLLAEPVSTGTMEPLRTGILRGSIVPVLTGSASKNVGVSLLMDAIRDYVPSPRDLAVAVQDGEPLQADTKGPLAALVFKTTADPYVGRLTYFRVYSG